MQMNNGNFDDRNRITGDGGPENQETPRARDVWHKKLYGTEGRGKTGGAGQAASEKDVAGQAATGQTGYAGGSAGSGQTVGGTVYYGGAPTGITGGKKTMLILACILAGLILLGILSVLVRGDSGQYGAGELSGAADVSGDHIGVLYVEGTISEDSGTYSQAYAMDAVQGMMDNNDNRGLMLFVNTPGGGVYESDELHLKIREYQETTGRPVYAYFASQATSGGYYISASADKIVANRNCWTGSIGVTIGTLYDISGLLERYGIQTETITSGANKAMGDITAPMTAEQRAIFQSLVDESYAQFVSIVADGRGLSEEYVRSISDGRIYTAQQAQQIDLVDDVVDTYEDAVEDMVYEYGLEDCDIREFQYVPETSLFSGLIQSVDRLSDALAGSSDISALESLMEDSGQVELQYMCQDLR